MDWKLVFSAFITLFIAELGDKTQLTVFAMSAEKQNPLSIFIGASLGLTFVTFLGTYFGGWITKMVPESIIKVVAGVLFIAMGIIILKEAFPSLNKYRV